MKVKTLRVENHPKICKNLVNTRKEFVPVEAMAPTKAVEEGASCQVTGGDGQRNWVIVD